MYANPYVAQKFAEMRIRDARRESETDRMLASARQPGQGHSRTWATMAAMASVAISEVLSNLVVRIFESGHAYWLLEGY
jgi:hypothetical protein